MPKFREFTWDPDIEPGTDRLNVQKPDGKIDTFEVYEDGSYDRYSDSTYTCYVLAYSGVDEPEEETFWLRSEALVRLASVSGCPLGLLTGQLRNSRHA